MEQEELYAREEKCLKSIRIVRKAILMRLFVTAILLWAVLANRMELWVMGLIALVLVINITGALPLIAEWRKQKQLLRELIEQEEI